MIDTLTLRFGKAPGQSKEPIAVTPVTVFVGPNNSGKSKVLTEIHQFCQNGQRNAENVILDTLGFETCDQETAEARLARVTRAPHPGEARAENTLFVGKKAARVQVQRETILLYMMEPLKSVPNFCQWYLSYNTLILDGKNRITLINEQPAGDLQHPQHTFQILFCDDGKRAEVRRIIHDAFGSYLVVDPTKLGRLRLRLSDRPPATAAEERGLDANAVKFHGAAQPIENSSDGVKAFTGIISEIIAGDPVVLLIDEPEAFLHPALAFNLGKEVALAGEESSKRIFVSTHSPTFVMGCIQSGAPVNIIRLTYRGGVATARVLRNDDILTLMRNPLLRSTGVLSGLFYEFVVVTESDADRAFYQEINERLLRFTDNRGVPNCLFLNAQNKQTVRTILKPLRELGIPAAGIVDIDVLKDGGAEWTGFLGSGFVPQLEHQSLGTVRKALKDALEKTGKNMKRDGGVNLLAGGEKETAENVIGKLREYGLFVIPGGELESWLPGLGVAGGHGPTWLIAAFERMGEDPESQEYVKPADSDVWAFMDQVRQWFVNPRRKGIPT